MAAAGRISTVSPVLTIHVVHGGIYFRGEVLCLPRWTPDARGPLRGEVYFRIVLLDSPAHLPSATLGDARIAVCSPQGLPSSSVPLEPTLRRALTFKESHVAYMTATDPALDLLQRTLKRYPRGVVRQTNVTELRRYAQGHVVIAGGRLDPWEAFGGIHLRQCLEAVARALLVQAYPSIPLYAHALPRPLVPWEDAPRLLFALQRPDGPDAAALVELGPALGLSLPEAPGEPDPRRCAVFHIIRGELERSAGRMPAGVLLERLAHGYGLTFPMAQLYLLSFIALGTPETELVLAPGHAVRLRDGLPLRSDRITREMVLEVAWQTELRDWAVTLRRPRPASWNTALPYLIAVAPRLQEVSREETSAVQEAELQQAMAGLERRLDVARETLAAIARRLPGDLVPYTEALERLRPVATSQTFSQVYAQARSVYPGPAGLAADVALLARVERVAAFLPEALAARSYLEGVALAYGHKKLVLEQQALLGALTGPALLESTAPAWYRLRARVQRFQARWAQAANRSTPRAALDDRS